MNFFVRLGRYVGFNSSQKPLRQFTMISPIGTYFFPPHHSNQVTVVHARANAWMAVQHIDSNRYKMLEPNGLTDQ